MQGHKGHPGGPGHPGLRGPKGEPGIPGKKLYILSLRVYFSVYMQYAYLLRVHL